MPLGNRANVPQANAANRTVACDKMHTSRPKRQNYAAAQRKFEEISSEVRVPWARKPEAELFSLAELDEAHRQVQQAFAPTAQYRWALLAERVGAEVWVKHENHTPIGAFKVRGGLIYVGRLAQEGAAPRGIISATRGNHGQSLAYAGKRFGVPVTIVVPLGNSTEKNAAMRAFGARLVEHGTDFDEARLEAARLAESDGLLFAPTFHPDLVLGVATWALELFRAAPGLDALYVPIGLGSSICGAIRTRDLLGLKTEIIGVESAHAPLYARCLAAGRAVEIESAETNVDGLAVRVPDPGALEMIMRGVSRVLTVSDDEAAQAIRIYWTDTHNLAEGAGAAALAGLMQEREKMAGKRLGVLLSGGNIDLALFKTWVAG
jgi:threonine dehydratase